MDKLGSNWELPIWDLLKKLNIFILCHCGKKNGIQNIEYVEIFQKLFFRYFKGKLEIVFMNIIFTFYLHFCLKWIHTIPEQDILIMFASESVEPLLMRKLVQTHMWYKI